MTVVHPNHIVGINSITVLTGDSLSVHKNDGSLIRTIVSNTGVSTFHAIEVSKGGGDLSVGVSTFFVDNSAGKIGIGTDVPARTLEVFSPTSSLSILTLRTAAGAYGQAGLSFASNPASGREKAAIFFQETTGAAHHAGDLCFSVDNSSGDAGTAGTAEERLRITKDGHVGVNTDFTGSQTWRSGRTLEIFGGGGNVTGELHLGANRGDSNQSVGSINFFDNTQDSNHRHIALIEADKTGSTSNKRGGDLIFFTKNDNVAAPTEKFRIQSDGKIGIGEDSPTYHTELKMSSTDAYSSSTLNSGQHQLRVNNAGAEGVAGILLTAEPSSGSAGHAGIRVIAPANGSADMTFSTRNAGTYGEKLRITAAGIVQPGADNTYDLGSISKRWANIYSADLQLSNKGSENEVDGTWGNYTIQEGESDLFLINRRNGKKYKFNLTEVS